MAQAPPPLEVARGLLEYSLKALAKVAPAMMADTPECDRLQAYAATADVLWAQTCEADKVYVRGRLQDIYRNAHGPSGNYEPGP